MKLLHQQNKTLYIGDESRAELYIEITPPKTMDDWIFLRNQIDEFMNWNKPKEVKMKEGTTP